MYVRMYDELKCKEGDNPLYLLLKFILIDWSDAVSYTHLDVYKRQLQDSDGALAF